MTDPTDIAAAADRVRAYLDIRAADCADFLIDHIPGRKPIRLTASDLRTLLAAVDARGREDAPEWVRKSCGTQPQRDALGPVAPRDSWMGMLRNGDIVGPFRPMPQSSPVFRWTDGMKQWAGDGRRTAKKNPRDVVAVWPPYLDAASAAIGCSADKS